MRLLPSITCRGNTLSLQYPFTLNEYLIRDVTMEITATNEISKIRFTARECGNVSFNENELKEYINTTLHNYIERNGMWYIDHTGSHMFDYSNYDEYIRAVIKQRESIIRGGNRYESDLYQIFSDQGRNTRYFVTSTEHCNLIQGSSRSLRGQRSLTFEPSFEYEFHFDDGPIRSFVTNTVKQEKYIHEYNYVPEYIPHYIDGERKSTTLLLGVEIEVGGNTDSTKDEEQVVKKCIQIMNGSDSTEENLIYSTHDGTVQIELDTMPCSLEFHKQNMNYRKLFKFLDKEGYKGHDCKTAGLHIHANREYLGSTPLLQQLTIAKILYIIEKFNEQICVIARRSNYYSVFVGDKKDEKSVVELYGKYKSYGKKSALNLQHKNTVEFRMFKSTLKYETFILTLEFVKDIIDYAKRINIEQIELSTWNDLMNTFSPELRKYYNSRIEKENNKKKKKECVSELEKRIEKIKKNIKDINNKIKKCKSFLEQKALKQDLEEAQKVLKKLQKYKREGNVNVSFNVIHNRIETNANGRVLSFEHNRNINNSNNIRTVTLRSNDIALGNISIDGITHAQISAIPDYVDVRSMPV